MILADMTPPSAVAWVILGLLTLVLMVLWDTNRAKRREADDTHELLRIAKEWVARGDKTLGEVKQQAAVLTQTAADLKEERRKGDSDDGLTTRTPPLPPPPPTVLPGPFPRPEDYHP